MLQLEAPPRTTPEHYESASGRVYDTSAFMITRELVNNFDAFCHAANEAIAWQKQSRETTVSSEAPSTMIIGNDVSGRVPALIMYGVLCKAYEDGYITTLPYLHFISSGSAPDIDTFTDRTSAESQDSSTDTQNELYDRYSTAVTEYKKESAENIAKHLARLVGSTSVSNVLIVDEFIATGNCLRRIADGLTRSGVTDIHYLVVGKEELWLGCEPSAESRRLVGIEEDGTAATAVPYPYTTAAEKEKFATLSDTFMAFLGEYITNIYREIKQSNFISSPPSTDDSCRITQNIPQIRNRKRYPIF